MTKFYIISILLSFSMLSTAQNYKKRLEAGENFWKRVPVREVLDTMLWPRETAIFHQTEKLFKQNGLDINKDHDYDFFQSRLMHQFLFSKRYIIKQVEYHYKHLPYDQLIAYNKALKKGQLQKVIYQSGLYAMLNRLLDEELTQMQERTIPKYIEFLVRKHKPVPLKITHNGHLAKSQDLPLNIYVETNNADYKKVSILDKKNSQILKPEGYTYDQIQKIVIEYKGKKFEFKPDKAIDLYPHQFKEVNSMVSEYSFNQIPVWQLEILEHNQTIGIKLTNVVESKLIKTQSAKRQINDTSKID